MAIAGGSGEAEAKEGVAIHMYTANKSMIDKSMYNSDGDFLIGPLGPLLHSSAFFLILLFQFRSLGHYTSPQSLAKWTLHPRRSVSFRSVSLFRLGSLKSSSAKRGIQFSVVLDGPSRGYVCEIFKGHFQLPDLGPIGKKFRCNEYNCFTCVSLWQVQMVLLIHEIF